MTPFTKNPNTSLYGDPTNSLYSSDANTYWNATVPAVGTKSNSSTAASPVDDPGTSASRSGSPTTPHEVPAPVNWFGPTTVAMSPELMMMPSSNPTMPLPPAKVPSPAGQPRRVTFE